MLYVCLRAIDHEHDSTIGMYIPLAAFTRHAYVVAWKLTG